MNRKEKKHLRTMSKYIEEIIKNYEERKWTTKSDRKGRLFRIANKEETTTNTENKRRQQRIQRIRGDNNEYRE